MMNLSETVARMDPVVATAIVVFAVVAASICAVLWLRTRRLDQDMEELTLYVQKLHPSDLIPTGDDSEPEGGYEWDMSTRPIFPPLYEEDARSMGLSAEDPTLERLDASKIASQLGAQSQEALEQLLAGRMNLSNVARTLGKGRQETALVQWLDRGRRLESSNA